MDTRNISKNFVYSQPTITALARYIGRLSETDVATVGDRIQEKVNEMQAMVEKYTRDLPEHTPNNAAEKRNSGDVVVLTGSTGGLGSSLLWKLIESPDVSQVFAINRRGGSAIIDRQRRALQMRGVDDGLLMSPKLVILEGDLSKEHLGLDRTVYELVSGLCSCADKLSLIILKIQTSATHIIHNGKYCELLRRKCCA